MAELINLNKARKAKARAAGKTQAAENRAKFGQTKAQKQVTRLDTERARRELDGKKRED
jgi:hypothetical protein